jgi:hypothetical protein
MLQCFKNIYCIIFMHFVYVVGVIVQIKIFYELSLSFLSSWQFHVKYLYVTLSSSTSMQFIKDPLYALLMQSTFTPRNVLVFTEELSNCVKTFLWMTATRFMQIFVWSFQNRPPCLTRIRAVCWIWMIILQFLPRPLYVLKWLWFIKLSLIVVADVPSFAMPSFLPPILWFTVYSIITILNLNYHLTRPLNVANCKFSILLIKLIIQ